MSGKLQTISKITAVLAMATLLGAPVGAQTDRFDGFGELGETRNMAQLVKQALRGAPAEGVIVEKLDGGLIKVAIPLRPDSPILRQKMAKDLVNMCLTVDLFEPDLFADIVSFDVAPIDELSYYAGWVTLNTSNNDIVATSSVKTKGPGPDLNTGNTDLEYTASAFNLFFVEFERGWDAGLHSVDAKVKGAKPGKLKGNFCAGCT